MDLYNTSYSIPLFVGGMILLILAIILWFRFRMNHYETSYLKQIHQNDGSRRKGLGRNKYTEVDIFKWSPTFWAFSLLSVLSMTIYAINWTNMEAKEVVVFDEGMFEVDIEMDIPRVPPPTPPPPPPPPQVITEVPDVVLEDVEQPEFKDQSIDAYTEVVTTKPTKSPPPPPPPPPPASEPIFVVAEDMPRFPGCEDKPSKAEREACSRESLLTFIYSNIKYPAIARENGLTGTVVASFVVEKDGRINNAEIVRDIGGGCGEEVLRVIKMMNAMPERWIPGKQTGKSVRVQFNLPVRFVLKD